MLGNHCIGLCTHNHSIIARAGFDVALHLPVLRLGRGKREVYRCISFHITGIEFCRCAHSTLATHTM